MPPILTIQSITLAQIDFNDFSYSISPERRFDVDETLKKSIADHGILHPPIIREIDSGFYGIVSGRKRLHTARALDAGGTCNCLVLSRQVPEVTVFHILLEEVQLTRQLTIIERAILLQKIAVIMDKKQIINEFLPRMGLTPDPFTIKQTLMLLDLENPILCGIHQGYVNEKIARDFVALSARDRVVLFEVITSLHLSFSNQKKLLTICRELSSRESTSIAALLDSDEAHATLHHPDANPPQKTKNLMAWLSRKHTPRSRKAEEEFRRFITGMQLPQNISVEHTPFFEDDSMTLSITFPNRKSLQHAWNKIRNATHNNGH